MRRAIVGTISVLLALCAPVVVVATGSVLLGAGFSALALLHFWIYAD